MLLLSYMQDVACLGFKFQEFSNLVCLIFFGSCIINNEYSVLCFRSQCILVTAQCILVTMQRIMAVRQCILSSLLHTYISYIQSNPY